MCVELCVRLTFGSIRFRLRLISLLFIGICRPCLCHQRTFFQSSNYKFRSGCLLLLFPSVLLSAKTPFFPVTDAQRANCAPFFSRFNIVSSMSLKHLKLNSLGNFHITNQTLTRGGFLCSSSSIFRELCCRQRRSYRRFLEKLGTPTHA